MKIVIYFFEFIFVYTFLIIFKIIGYKNASNFGEIIGRKIRSLEECLKLEYKELYLVASWGQQPKGSL